MDVTSQTRCCLPAGCIQLSTLGSAEGAPSNVFGIVTASLLSSSLYCAQLCPTIVSHPRVGGLSSSDFGFLSDGYTNDESALVVLPLDHSVRQRTVLLLDQSGSTFDNATTRQQIQAGIQGYLATIAPLWDVGVAHDITMVGFSGDLALKVILPWTADLDTAAAAAAGISALPPAAHSSTALYYAVQASVGLLTAAIATDGPGGISQGFLIVYTDGFDDVGNVTLESAQATLRATNITFIPIAVGSEVHVAPLQALLAASGGGQQQLLSATSYADLAQAFRNASIIQANANTGVYVENFCTTYVGNAGVAQHYVTTFLVDTSDAAVPPWPALATTMAYNSTDFSPSRCEDALVNGTLILGALHNATIDTVCTAAGCGNIGGYSCPCARAHAVSGAQGVAASLGAPLAVAAAALVLMLQQWA